jgi:hypothetical protein
MATTSPSRVSDKEVQARAKMAAFIDRVIDTIESTPLSHEPDVAKASRPAERPSAD